MSKILFLGEIREGQTSLMRLSALKRLGHQVRGVDTVEPWRKASWLQRQVQRRSGKGTIIDGINHQILQAARDFKPDIVWAEKQEYLRYETIRALRDLGALLVHFTPDPYFSLDWKRTPLMDAVIGSFDVLVYCKSYEKSQYEALDKPLIYMPLGFCDETHRPVTSVDQKWICDVGFLGGWEPRREKLLRSVVALGVQTKIRGVAWDFLSDGRWTLRRQFILSRLAGQESFRFHREPLIAGAYEGGEVYAHDYASALTGAKIGLGFLRAVCEDQHTTRTFEIPACGSMLLADRTNEHSSFFEEGKEADFFSTEAELLDKVKFYMSNEPVRSKIAAAGLERCNKGRYAYIHRLSDALAAVCRSS